MFSLVTAFIAMILNLRSLSFIDHRGTSIPGTDSGDATYQTPAFDWINVFTPNIIFVVNSWLADGLLVSSVSSSLSICLVHLKLFL